MDDHTAHVSPPMLPGLRLIKCLSVFGAGTLDIPLKLSNAGCAELLQFGIMATMVGRMGRGLSESEFEL